MTKQLFPNEMTPDEVESVEALMRPEDPQFRQGLDDIKNYKKGRYVGRENVGGISRAGFLAPWERLKKVHDRDEATLYRLGISFDQVADRLEQVSQMAMHNAHRMEQGAKAKGEDLDYWDIIKNGIPVDGSLSLTFVAYMGYQTCPFQTVMKVRNGDKKDVTCDMSDKDFTVSRGKESIFFSELHIHLIRDHHFFEGATRYRLDPEQAVRVLGIEPGKDYAPVYSTATRWRMVSGQWGGGMRTDTLGHLHDVARKTVQDHTKWSDPTSPDLMSDANAIEVPGTVGAWCDGNHVILISRKGQPQTIKVGGHDMDGFSGGVELFSKCHPRFVEDPTFKA